MTTPAHQPNNLAAWLRIQLDTDAAEIAKHPDDYEYEAWDLSAEMETYPCLRIGKKRALAEVDAKRRILDEYEKAFDRRRKHPHDLASAGALLQMISVIKLLALPYTDRPGFREEWRP